MSVKSLLLLLMITFFGCLGFILLFDGGIENLYYGITGDENQSKTWYVPDNGTYAEVYGNSSDGDTIIVYAGDVGSPLAKAIIVEAYNTTQTHIFITAAATLRGITLDGGGDITFDTTNAQDGQDKVGIFVNVDHVGLQDVVVKTIQGGAGSSTAPPSTVGTGGTALGIWINSSYGIFMDNVTIWNITGGASGSAQCDASHKTHVGGIGGSAYGIYSDEGSFEIKNSNVSNVTSANGGAGCSAGGQAGGAAAGGQPGDVYAIYTSNYTSIVNNSIARIVMGKPGNGAADHGTTDGIDGRTVYVIYGVDNNIIGFNTMSELKGGTGGKGAVDDSGTYNGGDGGDIYTIYLSNYNQIENNTIHTINGGAGSTGTTYDSGGYGGAGGDVYVIHTYLNNTIRSNSIYNIDSGTPAAGSASDTGSAGHGGEGGHIWSIRNSYVGYIYSNTIYDLDSVTGGTGGEGQFGAAGARGGENGTTVGIDISSNTTYTTLVYNNTLYDFKGGDAGAPGSPNAGTSPAARGGNTYGIYINDNLTSVTHYNNNMSNFTGGIRSCRNVAGTGYVCASDPDIFGNVIPIYSEKVSEISPQIEYIDTRDTYNITWYTVVRNYGTGSANATPTGMNYSLYYKNNTETEYNLIIDTNNTASCINMSCIYSWNHSTLNLYAYNLKVNSSTVNVYINHSYKNESISYAKLILDYTFSLLVYLLPSPLYRAENMICNFSVSNSINTITNASAILYKNSVSNQSDTYINVTSFDTNISSGFSVDKSYLSVTDIWNCIITITDGIKTVSNFSINTVTNRIPTTPTNMTCNGTTCPTTLGSITTLYGSGSTDADGDTIYYVVEAYNDDFESLPSATVSLAADNLRIDYCNGISSLIFDPDLSYFNFTSLTLTQYNVTAINASVCLFNASCLYNCPINITAKLNATSSTHNITCNNTVLNTSYQVIIENITSINTLFNCSMDYLNASSDFNFQINWSVE